MQKIHIFWFIEYFGSTRNFVELWVCSLINTVTLKSPTGKLDVYDPTMEINVESVLGSLLIVQMQDAS